MADSSPRTDQRLGRAILSFQLAQLALKERGAREEFFHRETDARVLCLTLNQWQYRVGYTSQQAEIEKEDTAQDAKMEKEDSADADHSGPDDQGQRPFQIRVEVLGQLEEVAQIGQSPIHQDNLGGVGRDGGGTTNRDRHLRLLQRNRVIDAVSDKTDRVA